MTDSLSKNSNNGRCRVCGDWRGPDGCCEPADGVVHLNRPSGQPRPGAGALCGADHRHGVMTTYASAHVTCERCLELDAQWLPETEVSLKDRAA